MHAFVAIAAQKNTNLAIVAPSISEALFTTAVGLIAAIPAYIFYNKLSDRRGQLLPAGWRASPTTWPPPVARCPSG